MATPQQPGLFPSSSPIEGPLPKVRREEISTRVAPLSSGPLHGDLPHPALGRSDRCRADGYEAIIEHAQSLRDRMEGFYQLYGPMSDQEMADLLDVDRTTVNGRRAELRKLGRVREYGSKKNPKSGVENTIYGLI